MLSPSVTLIQVNFLQLQWPDIVALETVLALKTLSLRDVVVVLLLVREVRRRSHIRRGNTLPLLVLLLVALPLIPLAKEEESDTSLKRRRRNTPNHAHPNMTSVRRSTRGGGVLLHLLPLRLLMFLQMLLLLLGEVQPGRSLELSLGLLHRLLIILTPLLGLRVRRHTGIFSVYVRVMMTNLIIRLQRIMRTQFLTMKYKMSPKPTVRFLRMTSSFRLLFKKSSSFFRPICFLRNRKILLEVTGRSLQ